MQRVLVPAAGLCDWRARLADPEKHWKRGASAFETAVSWEKSSKTAKGLPAEISLVLDQGRELCNAEVLIALPEHKVPLPGGQRASQTDVWVLLKSTKGLISMAVEGKAAESFGDSLGTWQKNQSAGKTTRLHHLCETLKLPQILPETLRYQLLHRTASAILEAQRFGASHAVMMVQAFRPECSSFDDFKSFGECLGVDAAPGKLLTVASHSNPCLYLGWAQSPLATDADIERASS